MDPAELERLEVDLLVQTILRRWGYDFSHYAKASLTRRLRAHIAALGVDRIGALIPLVLQDEKAFVALLVDLTVSVTEMFRDPFVYRTIREEVVPRQGSRMRVGRLRTPDPRGLAAERE